ncbi:YvcK family protein [Patescibacteria group bacterium]|nr:YvcK family protein [Patescibacteria group bacterium]
MKIVTIGGGSGQSLLLKYMKDYDWDISAIVSMVDSGGSTGILRKELGVLPPGDVRKCLLALATRHTKLQEAMAVRFDGGHNFGNFVLSGLELKFGSFDKAVKHVEKVLQTKDRVIPSTLDDVQLAARLKNKKLITGEANIDIPNGRRAKIDKVFLKPIPKISRDAREAIRKANFIVYTIGDLYTSLIPNLLVKGMQEEIAKSEAVKIFTINRTNKKGETDGFTASQYIETLLSYLKPGSLDYVLVDKCKLKIGKGYEQVKVDKNKIEDMGVLVEEAVICSKKDPNHVDGKLLARALYKLCQK